MQYYNIIFSQGPCVYVRKAVSIDFIAPGGSKKDVGPPGQFLDNLCGWSQMPVQVFGTPDILWGP